MSRHVNILALDVGTARIGVARVNMVAKLPEPLVVLPNDDGFIDRLQALITEYNADAILVGLPRNLSGEETKQSELTRQFVNSRLSALTLDIIFQDETLSSIEAQSYLGKKYPASMEDALAACVILQDYINGEGA